MSRKTRSEALRVVVADSHTLARMSVAHLLDWEEGLDVVAQPADARGLLADVRRLDPDVAVVDLGLWRDSSGLIDELRRISPGIGIVVLTMHEEEWQERQLAADAAARLLKDSPPAEMIEAVRSSVARQRGNGSGTNGSPPLAVTAKALLGELG